VAPHDNQLQLTMTDEGQVRGDFIAVFSGPLR
jgi:hypothetical protein